MATTTNPVENPYSINELLIMQNYGRQIEAAKGGFNIPGFEKGRVYEASDDRHEIEFPGTDNCAFTATYYALNYLGVNISLDEVKTGFKNKSIDHMESAKAAVEGLSLMDMIPEEIEAETNIAPGYLFVRDNRPEHTYTGQIEKMAEEILQGGVLLFDVEAVNEFRDVDFSPEEPEERHAIAIFGFEINDKGVPIFYAFDSNVARSKPVRLDAKRLLEFSSFDHLIIRRKKESQENAA